MDLEIGDAHFTRIAHYIEDNFGISVPPEKRVMIQSRLARRVFDLKCKSVDEYIELVLSRNAVEEEVDRMIDLISTHLTSFFREPGHFEYLSQSIIPELLGRYNFTIHSPLVVWSAACASGEEVWTLAMVLALQRQVLKRSGIDLEFAVLGTDLSPVMVQQARKAIYSWEALKTIPEPYRGSFTMRSSTKTRFRVVPELRQRAFFRNLNLMDQPYRLNNPVQVIFCRNVLIYFNQERRYRVLLALCDVLDTGGYLFLGHAESLANLKLPLVQCSPTVYRKLAPGEAHHA